ncbi:MAG: hypothetical protein ACRDAM_13220 [Casimicrobium sp.]
MRFDPDEQIIEIQNAIRAEVGFSRKEVVNISDVVNLCVTQGMERSGVYKIIDRHSGFAWRKIGKSSIELIKVTGRE